MTSRGHVYDDACIYYLTPYLILCVLDPNFPRMRLTYLLISVHIVNAHQIYWCHHTCISNIPLFMITMYVILLRLSRREEFIAKLDKERGM